MFRYSASLRNNRQKRKPYAQWKHINEQEYITQFSIFIDTLVEDVSNVPSLLLSLRVFIRLKQFAAQTIRGTAIDVATA
jgi:hypothetical protein